MACKSDDQWEGAYVYKDNCVKWDDLTNIRKDFNKLWDILKKEDKQDGNKYGYRGEEQSVREQIESLATIEGFFGLRYDNSLSLDEIYFYITAGTILDRLKGLGSEYSYDHAPNGKNFGPWIVWLKDSCHGCTVFRFVNADVRYPRHLYCNGQYIPNIDNDAWRLQCIWSWNGCNYPGEVLGDWRQYCHINWDWRDPQYWQQYLRNVADRLFVKGPICVPINDPCTVTRQWCCGLYAIAHYTEEDAWGEGCDFNGPCEEDPRYVCRRLKYVSLGVTTSNPGEEVHGLFNQDGSSGWDTFFCCPNQISGGQIKGHVTQKICAIHLTDIWDRTNTMVGGKTLRKCFYNQCKYYESNEKKYRWVYKESVPMYVSGSTADIMDRKDECQNCDKAAEGANICACNFNDINAMLEEYNAATCSCQNEGANKGKTLTNFGDISSCDCCKAKCCCDCNCEDNITKTECEKKQCKKNGPKWVGVYEKGQSKDDKKLGDAKPCGCYEGGNEPDPPFPDVSCMEVCGKTAACCDNKTCECETLTKCECDDKKGSWQGFRSSDGSYKGSSWKKGDPKRCGDEDINEKPECGKIARCCIKDDSGYECTCTTITRCDCEQQGGTWSSNIKDCQTPCPNLPKGRCCADGSCSCSGDCPGPNCEGKGGTPDGCCCDGACYTGCNDCCDYASAVACCSGSYKPSIYFPDSDPFNKLFFNSDDVIKDLSKIDKSYDFVSNAFDIFLAFGAMYVYRIDSIKIGTFNRYLALKYIFDLHSKYEQLSVDDFIQTVNEYYILVREKQKEISTALRDISFIESNRMHFENTPEALDLIDSGRIEIHKQFEKIVNEVIPKIQEIENK